MVQLIAQGRRMGKDRSFNLNQADLFKSKILLEDKLGVPKSWFASYGRQHIKDPATEAMYQTHLKALQQAAFGHSIAGIKKSQMSITRQKSIAILRNSCKIKIIECS